MRVKRKNEDVFPRPVSSDSLRQRFESRVSVKKILDVSSARLAGARPKFCGLVLRFGKPRKRNEKYRLLINVNRIKMKSFATQGLYR